MTAPALPYPDKLSYSSVMRVKDTLSVFEMGDGYQQRMEIGLNAKHEEWDIIYPALTDAEKDTALSVFDAVRCVQYMTWSSPIYNTQKKYVIMPNSRQINSVGVHWRLQLTIREVFEP